MNSYHKRKQEIAYLLQCINELEGICFSLAKQLNENNIQVNIDSKAVCEDDLITPYNSGKFLIKLAMQNEL